MKWVTRKPSLGAGRFSKSIAGVDSVTIAYSPARPCHIPRSERVIQVDPHNRDPRPLSRAEGGTRMHITDPDHRFDETISGSWQLDPQRSSLAFCVGHFWGLGTVSGHFESGRGRLDLNANPPIVLTIDTASLQTGNRRRDRHLRSAAFSTPSTTRKCGLPPIGSTWAQTLSRYPVSWARTRVRSRGRLRVRP